MISVKDGLVIEKSEFDNVVKKVTSLEFLEKETKSTKLDFIDLMMMKCSGLVIASLMRDELFGKEKKDD